MHYMHLKKRTDYIILNKGEIIIINKVEDCNVIFVVYQQMFI